MIEELQIVREIFGDLSAMGIWAIVAYFAYKVLVIVGWLTGLYVVFRIADKIYRSIVESNKSDAALIDSLKINLERANQSAAESKAESERVKHMYKILKESSKND